MGQRLAQVKQQAAALVVVLVVVNRDNLGAEQRHETAGFEAHTRSERRRIGQVVLRRIDPLTTDACHVRIVGAAGNRVRDLADVDVGHESNRAIALDVQVALGELESVLIPCAERIDVVVGLIEVVLVARINHRVDC